MERDAVASTSDFAASSGKGVVDRNSSCVSSISVSPACSEELPVVQIIRSVPVETAVSMEVSTFVEGRVDAVMVEQSPKTRFHNSKAPDFHLSGMLTLIQTSVRIGRRLHMKASQVPFSRILVEVNHLQVKNLGMVNHLHVSDQVEVMTMAK